jgi:predicted NACHT family NTPase
MSKKRLTVKATPQGLVLAQNALKRLGGTQLSLAKKLTGSVGRSTIQKFFQGEEIQVDKFQEICRELLLESQWEAITQSAVAEPIADLANSSSSIDLQDFQLSKQGKEEQDSSINNVQVGSGNYNESIGGHYVQGHLFQGNIYINKSDIAEPLTASLNQNNTGLESYSVDIETLVQSCRENIKPYIKERCGTIRVLDMTQPIGLGEIYTNVNILEKITGRRRRKSAELVQNLNSESDEFKRTWLSKIAQEQIPGLEAVERYSKLIVLGKPGAGKTTFLKYLAIQCISGKFQADRIPIFITLKQFAETQNNPDLRETIIRQLGNNLITNTQVSDLLNSGNFLILLDGLDEVREQDTSQVIIQIKDFSEQYHNNQFVITCRIAAREYTYEKFTEVEVADFNAQQIKDFANKWFGAKDDVVKAEDFIQKLKQDKPIGELATSPLLLTLLCLVFEESGDFPTNRSELYKEGLDALLKKWDAKRGIYRDQVYNKLSVQRKEDLLSKIAWTTFACGDYFFKQKVAEEHITEYMNNLLSAKANQFDSEKF